MALNEQERQIAEFGAKNGKSSKEIQDAISKYRTTQQPQESTLGTQISKRVETAKAGFGKDQTKTSATFQAVGQGAGAVLDVIGAGIKAIPGAETAGKVIAGGVGMAIEAMPKEITDLGGEAVLAYKKLKQSHPELVANLEATGNILSILPVGKVAQVAGRGVVAGTKASVGLAGEAIKPVADIASSIASGASRIPSRIATNVAEKQATEATIKALPTKIAQGAARDGIDVPDVKFIYELPKTQRAPLKKLADITAKFARGETKTDPIEVVGKPIINRIKQLESEKSVVGKKLGEVSKKLGVVTKEELETPIFNSLVKSVPGLTVKDGVLNFKNTTLALKEAASDRKAIQSLFTQSTKWGNGEAKHKMRQAIFEVLGGKKKSLANITDTQEKAYEAIRKGLSDVLDAKNPAYKQLNKEFAIKAQPLADLRKMMKTIPGATEDILDMQAGLLARRLTSTSMSGAQLKGILKRMDEATKVKGKTKLSVENLQDFYNILNKYYDLAPKTGFQGQVKAGVEGATGAMDLITGAVRGVAGETTAVRQKAFEKVLQEALRTMR